MHVTFSTSAIAAKHQAFIIICCFLFSYLFIGFHTLLKGYLILDSNAFLGIALLPYVCIIKASSRKTFTYLILALFFLIISFLLPMRSMYYLTLSFAILFVLESYLGKFNYLPVFLITVLSPVFKYITTIFGFPIRLKLSEVAGKLIQLMGYQAEVHGNIIQINGHEFSVDAACVGLQMMTTSFIIGIFLLAFYERKSGRPLSFLFTLLVMAAIAGLNIICNLIRIVTLVLFKLMPESPFHYLAGLICFIVYVIIPLCFLIKWLYAKTNSGNVSYSQISIKSSHLFVSNTFLLIGLLMLFFHVKNNPHIFQVPPAACMIAGYSQTNLESGVTKLENKDALVYVKPIARQYGIEHSPMICWQGSGYTFKNISKTTVNGIEVYTGILVKDQDMIHTAWWFDNGTHKTIDQFNWRWQIFKGGHGFSLINVNTTNKALLLQEVKNILSKNIFTK